MCVKLCARTRQQCVQQRQVSKMCARKKYNTYSSARVMIRAQACLRSFLPVCLPDVVRFDWLVYDSVRINSWKNVWFEKFEDTRATTTDNDDKMTTTSAMTAINGVQQDRTRTVA